MCVQVEDEELPAHRIILTARSPVFRALLNSDMREVQEGVVTIEDIRPQVFSAMLHFVYKDALPEVRGPFCHSAVHPLAVCRSFSMLYFFCDDALLEVGTLCCLPPLLPRRHQEDCYTPDILEFSRWFVTGLSFLCMEVLNAASNSLEHHALGADLTIHLFAYGCRSWRGPTWMWPWRSTCWWPQTATSSAACAASASAGSVRLWR
jgi:hypothetical protein